MYVNGTHLKNLTVTKKALEKNAKHNSKFEHVPIGN